MIDHTPLRQLLASLQVDDRAGLIYLPLADLRRTCVAAVAPSADVPMFRSRQLCRQVVTVYGESGFPVTVRGAYMIEGLLISVAWLLGDDEGMATA